MVSFQCAKPCLLCYPTQMCDRIRPLNLDSVPSLCIFKIPTGFWTMLGLGYWGENDRLNMKFGRCNLFFFSLPSLIPVAISVVLSCLFVHYLCIIRQTIIPLCFASVVQMLTGNESPQRPVKGTCYYQTAIHSQPIRDESITFEKSCAEREKLFIWASAAQRNISVFIRSQRTFFFFFFEVKASRIQVTVWPHVMSPACVIVSYSGHF